MCKVVAPGHFMLCYVDMWYLKEKASDPRLFFCEHVYTRDISLNYEFHIEKCENK